MTQEVYRERMTLLGDLGAATLLPWIRRHAAKLGLCEIISYSSPERVEIDVAGPSDLIDMLEMGCSLGPIDVWVDTIVRMPLDDVGR